MSGFVGFVLVTSLFFSAVDACSELFDEAGFIESDLSLSNDPEVRASSDSSNGARAVRLQATATSKENLAKGEKIGFDAINEAILLNTTNPKLYVSKMAMAVAANRNDLAASTSRQMIGLYQGNHSRFYDDYALELSRVYSNLPQGSQSQHFIFLEYCSHVGPAGARPAPNTQIRCN